MTFFCLLSFLKGSIAGLLAFCRLIEPSSYLGGALKDFFSERRQKKLHKTDKIWTRRDIETGNIGPKLVRIVVLAGEAIKSSKHQSAIENQNSNNSGTKHNFSKKFSAPLPGQKWRSRSIFSSRRLNFPQIGKQKNLGT